MGGAGLKTVPKNCFFRRSGIGINCIATADNNIKFVPLNASTTGIALSRAKVELGRCYTSTLSASVTPVDSAYQLTWTSTDENIVTVYGNGTIKGVASSPVYPEVFPKSVP